MAAFRIIFKHDDIELLTVNGALENPKGEPYDTVYINNYGIRELDKAIGEGKAPHNAYDIGNLTVVEYPLGNIVNYTDPEMEQKFAAVAEANRFHPTRNSCVRITLEGGFSGGLIGEPVVVSLADLGEAAYTRAVEIIDLLQTYGAKLDYTGEVGDFGYYVYIGNDTTSKQNMRRIFNGGPFSGTPTMVVELKKLLAPLHSSLDEWFTDPPPQPL